jgi:hypothetical protein
MTDLDTNRSNSLVDLATRINEAHRSAIHHAGKALEQAIACGQMLLEAKAKVPHGQWLPWLRQNVTFGERSAQGYMRLVHRVPPEIRNGVSDFPSLRTALRALATPRRHWREAMDAELEQWSSHADFLRANRPEDVSEWSRQDAKNCADILRGYDSILHRYGICEQEDCLVCDALGLNGPDYVPPEPGRSQLIAAARSVNDRANMSGNTQRVADLDQR